MNWLGSLTNSFSHSRANSAWTVVQEVIHKHFIGDIKEETLLKRISYTMIDSLLLATFSPVGGPPFFLNRQREVGSKGKLRVGTVDYHTPQFGEFARRHFFPGSGPALMFFSITGDCSCNCEYCYADVGQKKQADLGDDVIFEVARQVARSKIPFVGLSGGEPLTHFNRLLETAKILRDDCHVALLTNGIGLTQERLSQLVDAGISCVFVSFDSIDRDIFEAVRGKPGAFDAAVDALRLCSSAGVATVANCVVGHETFPTKESIHAHSEFLANIHPDIILQMQPKMATGRGNTAADSLTTVAEGKKVAKRCISAFKRHKQSVAIAFGAIDEVLGCLGTSGLLLSLDHAGNITACISKASFGNILEEPFETIYQRYITACKEYKSGYFCCELGKKYPDEKLLDRQASQVAVWEFSANTENAMYQNVLEVGRFAVTPFRLLKGRMQPIALRNKG